MKLKYLLASLMCAVAVMHAHAHQIWIEPAAKGYSLHFGEYDENLKETSPGLLDKMPSPVVTDDKLSPLAPVKQKDGFALNVAKADSIVAEMRNYPLFEKKNGEQVMRTKWVPAARHVHTLAARPPVNLLDIVPSAKAGHFVVYFRGQSLAKAKVTLVAPNGWQKQLQSDQHGEVEVTTLWRGLYLLEVGHKEAVAGEIGGDAYDAASFTSTLTFNISTGPETPRPEAARPNQGKP